MALRQVRIVSDGSGSDTVVTDETGKAIPGIASASISVEARGFVEVTLELTAPELDIHGTVTEVHFSCPMCTWSHDHQCKA